MARSLKLSISLIPRKAGGRGDYVKWKEQIAEGFLYNTLYIKFKKM